MGVKDLWPLLDGVKTSIQLDDISGSTVAIDLGFWTCQLNSVDSSLPPTYKLYLRNLLFRIKTLLQYNITPIFISEGKPPQIKQETIKARLKQRKQIGRSFKDQNFSCRFSSRSHFNSLLKECCQLIRLLGLEVYESDGEAEALCAALNHSGVVDAVITDDNDVFLYGALKVYRNFGLDGKVPSVDCYEMRKIESELGLDRRRLVALALLLGCDYCPAGVAGVGRERALRFFNSLDQSVDVLSRMRRWRDPDYHDEVTDWAKFVKLRAAKLSDFPDERIIDEYLKDRRLVARMEPKKDAIEQNFLALLKFLTDKLEWSDDYVIKTIVPMMTLTHLRSKISQRDQHRSNICVVKIVKERMRRGENYLDLHWTKLDCDEWTKEEYYVTTEQQALISFAYPDLLATFLDEKSKKTTSRTTKKAFKQGTKLASDLEEPIEILASNLGLVELGGEEAPTSPSDLSTVSVDSSPFLPLIERIRRLRAS